MIHFSRSLVSKLRGFELTTSLEVSDPILQTLCRWKRGNDILDLICDWLQPDLVPPVSIEKRVKYDHLLFDTWLYFVATEFWISDWIWPAKLFAHFLRFILIQICVNCCSYFQRSKGRTVTFADPVQPKPELALKYLERLMYLAHCRSLLLENNRPSLCKTTDCLKNVLVSW